MQLSARLDVGLSPLDTIAHTWMNMAGLAKLHLGNGEDRRPDVSDPA